ncbi:MAG: sulfatase-like hydrolase/transferase [Myxococcales bacterium]|nr:sulfatase-like hydrolase/transferase [Myxococcales bacterium]
MRIIWVIAAATAGCTGTPEPTEPALEGFALTFDGPAPSNLIVLSLDTMRKDHMGRYAAGDSLTPFLDARAAEGVALDDFVVCSNWTTASTACVMAGATNLERGADRQMLPIVGPTGPAQEIPAEPQLAKQLSDAGFETLFVTSNGFYSRSHGNAQGFRNVVYEGPRKVQGLWELAKDRVDPARGGGLPSPFYLHVHFFEPHRPYTPPEEVLAPLIDELPPSPVPLDTVDDQNVAVGMIQADPPVLEPDEIETVKEHMRARYRGEVISFDNGLSFVWEQMRELGLLDDALVLFFTDHGEALWEHGFTFHGRLLHRNENDAIAWFWADNLVSASVDRPTGSEDLAPSVLTALGVAVPDTMTGLPVGTGPEVRDRLAFADAYQGVVQSVQREHHLLHFQWDAPPAGRTNLALYDLQADPGEQTNLYDPAAPSAIALELWSVLAPAVVEAKRWLPDNRTVNWPDGVPRPSQDGG